MKYLDTMYRIMLSVTIAFALATNADAATLATKNAFAYDIVVNKDNPQKPIVAYNLSGSAKSVTVRVTISYKDSSGNSQTLNYDTAGTTNQSNSVQVDLTGQPAGTLTFKVITYYNTVSTPTLVSQDGCDFTYGHGFYAPWGLAINNYTNSETFGRIFVTETKTWSNTATSNANRTKYVSHANNGNNSGIYAFDPQFQPITNSQNSNKQGFTANLTRYNETINSSYSGWTSEKSHNFNRLAMSDDGRLFVSRIVNNSQPTLYEVDPSNLNRQAFPIFDGTISTTGVVSGVAGTVVGFDVIGSGANMKLVALTAADGWGNSTGNPLTVATYNLGNTYGATSWSDSGPTGKSWTSAPSSSFTYGSYAASSTSTKKVGVYGHAYTQIIFDKNGTGAYFSANRTSASVNSPCLAHFVFGDTPIAEFPDAISVDNFQRIDGNAIARYRTGTRIAIACTNLGSSNNAIIKIFSVSYNDDGTVKSMKLEYTYDVTSNCSSFTKCIDCMAFDYAGNLYFGGHNSERVFCLALPMSATNNSVSAMTKYQYTRKVTVSGPTNFTATPSATDGKIALSWSAATVTQDNLAYYVIERQYNDGDWTTIKSASDAFTGTSLTDSGLGTSYGTYNYRITAYASNGTAGSSVTVQTTYENPKIDAPTNAKKTVNAAWKTGSDGSVYQETTVGWDAVSDAVSYNVYLNGTVYANVTTNECVIRVPMTGSTSSVYITAVSAYGVESDKSNVLTMYNAGFGTLTVNGKLEITDEGGQNAVFTWAKPKTGGTVNHYAIYHVVKSTDSETGEEVETDYLLSDNIASNVLTYTKTDMGNEDYSFRVIAHMEQTIVTTKETNKSTAVSETCTVACDNTICRKPVIDKVETYTGRDVALISWSFSVKGKEATYYKVSRDGIIIEAQTGNTTFTDTMIPDGQHTYVVTAVYGDEETGTMVESAPFTCDEIKRVADKTGYAITQIYNYPIYTQEEKDKEVAAGDTKDAIIVKDPYLNMKSKVGAWGGVGDVYRQGTYYNGKWYVAQITTKPESTASDGSVYIASAASTGLLDDDVANYTGGVLVFDANDPLNVAVTKPYTFGTWENQSIAIDAGGNIITRYGGTTAEAADRKTSNSTYLWHNPISWLRCIRSGTESDIDISNLGFYNLWKDNKQTYNQYYRTHYLSAGGDASTAAGADVYLAMNNSTDVWKININSSNGYTAEVFRPDGYSEGDKISNTENYAFPMPSEFGGFIQQVRSVATYYVNKNGKYTQLYNKTDNDSDVRNVGGSAFVYNGRLFILHPTSPSSTNIGNFRVDMAHKNDLDADVTTSDMSILIPMVTLTQEGSVTNTSGGNISANWFGTEAGTYVDNGETKDCVYVYQYVPGVRFAKYRFYKYATPETPEPKLEIKTVYTEDNSDIERFITELSWVPQEGYEKANEDYKLDHYEAELLDDKMNVIGTSYLFYDENATEYSTTFGTDNNDINTYTETKARATSQTSEVIRPDVTYTARITPVYVNQNNDQLTVTTETTASQGLNTINSDPVTQLSAKMFKTRDGKMYRIDINFNGPENAMSDPASFFRLEVKGKNESDSEYHDIDGLYINYGGTRNPATNLEYSYLQIVGDGIDSHDEGDTEQGIIPGGYSFSSDGTASNAQRRVGAKAGDTTDHSQEAVSGDKLYALSDLREGEAEPCVAFYWTSEDPSDNVYRVTTQYAASNSALSEGVTAETDASQNTLITTDNVDLKVDTSDGLTVYPIPTEGDLHIRCAAAIAIVRIYSTSGALVKEFMGGDDNQITIDLSGLAAGNYLVRVNSLRPVHILKR